MALLDIAAERAGSNFCPSEVARRLTDDRRPIRPGVRRVAATLPLLSTQIARLIDPLAAKGPNLFRKA